MQHYHYKLRTIIKADYQIILSPLSNLSLLPIKMNRQRKRAKNIIRCHRNVAMLHFVSEEKKTIRDIDSAFSKEPSLIQYVYGQMIIAEGFNTNTAAKLELDCLKQAFDGQRIGLEEYKSELRALYGKVITSTAANKVSNTRH